MSVRCEIVHRHNASPKIQLTQFSNNLLVPSMTNVLAADLTWEEIIWLRDELNTALSSHESKRDEATS